MKKNNLKNSEEDYEMKENFKSLYTFVFGRNLYTIRMSDIKKVTLLGHQFIDKKDDKDEVTKTLYIFSITGNQIQGINDQDSDGNPKPLFETIMEVKTEETDYSTIYNIYEDLVSKWEKYLQSTNTV
jgi:hypothetical protein